MLEYAKHYMEDIFPPIIMNLYEAIKNNDTKIKEIYDKELVSKLNNEEFIEKTNEL